MVGFGGKNVYQHSWDRLLKLKIHPRQRLKMLLSDVNVELRINDVSIGNVGAGSINLLGKWRGIRVLSDK